MNFISTPLQLEANRTPSVSLQVEILSARTGDSFVLYDLSCRIFGWTYEFVGHKQRYSKLFRSLAVEQALGSIAAHSACMQQAPTSTVQRLHQEAVPQISEQMQAKAWAAAKTMTG
jgi:hypothetical protein